MKEIDINGLLTDYVENGFGVNKLCKKYHLGKIKVKALLDANGIPRKKKGKQPLNEDFVVSDFHIKKYEEHDGFHYEAIDEKTNFKSRDYMNNGGVLTTYIKKQYRIPIPTLYDRRMYYMRTGDYWWEQWFKIVEVENKEIKKCPYCDWETKDVENKSGAFEIHLITKHGINKEKYLEEHPEDKLYFQLANKTLNLQMETDENKFVTCKVCGKKLTRITDVHLKKHGLTKIEYMEKFGLSGTTCNALHEKMSKLAVKANVMMDRDFSSHQEREIKEYVESLGYECYTDRHILRGKELDIFIPSKNIAIEFNGNMWHSEKFGKDRLYHLNKLNECNKNGIGLIQIFEDEYEEHREIVLSKIKHILGADAVNCKIQGRKCKIQEILKVDAEAFLNQNHIQGFSNSTVYLGAIYEGRIVAVMCFLNENNGNWNLTRFASLNGYICQGVASKMFKHFIRNYDPRYVRSFADRRWTVDSRCNLYTKLGFELDETLKPEYRYYNPQVDKYKRFHKFGFRKSILHNKYGLPMHMTETEMATALGYVRIWDCGLFKYVWRKEE